MTVLRARITRDAPSGRRMELLAAAAQRFAMRGYAATSMRDIAADAGLLAGSMYHHFASKDEMLFEAYKVGVERVIAAHSAAIVGVIEPWARLEAACCGRKGGWYGERRGPIGAHDAAWCAQLDTDLVSARW